MELNQEAKDLIKAVALTENTARYAIECMTGHSMRARIEYAKTGELKQSTKKLLW